MSNKLGVACIAAMEVRHELLMLPYYGVFDNLTYTAGSTGTIPLQGQVTRPTLKSGAERAVKAVEGVSRVANHIEVLPLSPHDDNLRISLYRAIYGSARLNRCEDGRALAAQRGTRGALRWSAAGRGLIRALSTSSSSSARAPARCTMRTSRRMPRAKWSG